VAQEPRRPQSKLTLLRKPHILHLYMRWITNYKNDNFVTTQCEYLCKSRFVPATQNIGIMAFICITFCCWIKYIQLHEGEVRLCQCTCPLNTLWAASFSYTQCSQIRQPSYSPDMAPCDSFLFLTFKKLHNKRFDDVQQSSCCWFQNC
jgi:hypothetical protein